ncbi:hypothetical protein TNCV_1365021 [Trichonephila clavipes]|nr:hypothetical protein TNCV_1365021 [Trichonephila clavipes]
MCFLLVGHVRSARKFKILYRWRGHREERDLELNDATPILNTLAIRDVEYPRCLDNPEQRVFDVRCVVVHKNKFITDSTTENEHEEVELDQCIVGPS